jgi:hypothetical protein
MVEMTRNDVEKMKVKYEKSDRFELSDSDEEPLLSITHATTNALSLFHSDSTNDGGELPEYAHQDQVDERDSNVRASEVDSKD